MKVVIEFDTEEQREEVLSTIGLVMQPEPKDIEDTETQLIQGLQGSLLQAYSAGAAKKLSKTFSPSQVEACGKLEVVK